LIRAHKQLQKRFEYISASLFSQFNGKCCYFPIKTHVKNLFTTFLSFLIFDIHQEFLQFNQLFVEFVTKNYVQTKNKRKEKSRVNIKIHQKQQFE
jgi:hypothetical protein